MSVISAHDVTEERQEGTVPLPAGDAAVKPGHLQVEISPTVFAEPTDAAAGATDRPLQDSHHQATIALNVSDVLDLGTERIEGLDALVIDGELGDSVHLANEPGYVWSRVEASPEGYQMFEATIVGEQSGGGMSITGHAQPIYVLVQHDLSVILQST